MYICAAVIEAEHVSVCLQDNSRADQGDRFCCRSGSSFWS